MFAYSFQNNLLTILSVYLLSYTRHPNFYYTYISIIHALYALFSLKKSYWDICKTWLLNCFFWRRKSCSLFLTTENKKKSFIPNHDWMKDDPSIKCVAVVNDRLPSFVGFRYFIKQFKILANNLRWLNFNVKKLTSNNKEIRRRIVLFKEDKNFL